jgi:hypothetical protein
MTQAPGAPDPFLIPPELWFAVLCEEVGFDAQKRLNLARVFSRVHVGAPPGRDGPPFAHLRGILAVGFSAGVGEFRVDVELRNVDEQVLWRRAEPWIFRVGPGDASGAMVAEQVEYFFTELGNYYFALRLRPPGTEFLVRLEVAPPAPIVEESGS